MAQKIISIGANPNDGTGDPLRTAYDKINENFNEIYARTTVGSNFTFSDNSLTVVNENGNINLVPNGTGKTRIESNSLTITGSRTITDFVGSSGDEQGMIAWDSDYIYVCVADYDGSTEIWKRALINQIENQTFSVTETAVFVDGDMTVSGNSDLGNISISGNGIVVTTTDTNLEISANGTGTIILGHSTTVNGSMAVGDLNIFDNRINVTATDTDLELSANGTGEVTISGNPVLKSDIDQAGAGSIEVNNIVKISQADFDELSPPDPQTVYIIEN